MTYFGFLLCFLVTPIIVLGGVALMDRRRGAARPAALRGWPLWAATLLHVVIAVVYTTAWDNYLVATGVWSYDPALVTGITIGWVPLEEYTFFVLQPILAGAWLLLLMRRLRLGAEPLPSQSWFRLIPVIALAGLWLMSLAVLLAGWRQGTYLALQLVWALPPLAAQVGFGGDILARYGRLVGLSIVPLTLYFSAADALAIGQGIWAINPATSLPLLIGGVLPIEEFLFFLLTNTLVTFGIVLTLARESRHRLQAVWHQVIPLRINQGEREP